jgi:hypothetical protein
LNGVQARYNKYLVDGEPQTGFNEHRAAFERIQAADKIKK